MAESVDRSRYEEFLKAIHQDEELRTLDPENFAADLLSDETLNVDEYDRIIGGSVGCQTAKQRLMVS